jgi:ribosome-binding factor A
MNDMDNTRQNKIAKLIQKELAEIFLGDGIPVYDCMITVTQTKVTPDLSLARSYLSIFNADDNDKVLKVIKKNTKDIRFRLAQKVKNQLRVIPQLDFFIDDSLDYLENIENLLKS